MSEKIEYCIHCWLVKDVNNNKKRLSKSEKEYESQKAYPGYEDNWEGQSKKEEIEKLRTIIDAREKQLSEFTCLQNDTCGKKCRDKGGAGIAIKECYKCGKYLMLNFPDKTNYKSQGFYVHEERCQAQSNQLAKSSSQPEQEKESNLKQYFQEHNIHSITLQNNNLLITYQNGETKQTLANNQQLQQIKAYCAEKPNQTIELAELKQNQQTNQPEKTNYLPWILGGVEIFALIGIIVYFVMKNNEKEREE